MKQIFASLLFMTAPFLAVGRVAVPETLNTLEANQDVFTKVYMEPQFNFWMLDKATKEGGNTTCSISSIDEVDLIIAIRYGALPDAYGDNDCSADTSGNTAGSNNETCTTIADSQERAYIQVVVKQEDGGNAENALDIRCNTDTVVDASDCACFSGGATVDVLDKGITRMKELKVGDRVKGQNGVYQPVYAMAHVEEDTFAKSLEIETVHGTDGPLMITGDHLVFVDGKANPVRADSLSVGDKLILEGEGHNTTTRVSPITKIESVYNQGLYAPLTPDGTIVVNGVLASTYVSLMGEDFAELENGFPIMSWHGLIHMYLSPIRLACLGPISSQLCHFSRDKSTGYASFVTAGNKFVEWVNQQNLIVQLMTFVVFVLGLAPFLALEYFMVRGVLLASVVGAVSWAVLRKKHKAL